jgi:hypothetical protein
MAHPAQQPEPADATASDAVLDAALEQALAPWIGKLPPAELAWMRAELEKTAREHEGVRRLVEAATPRDVDRSGEVVRPLPTR